MLQAQDCAVAGGFRVQPPAHEDIVGRAMTAVRAQVEEHPLTIAKRELGELIKNARIAQGISQLCLAAELGLTSGQAISNLERGIGALSPRHIVRMTEVLKVDRAQLEAAFERIAVARARLQMETHEP